MTDEEDKDAKEEPDKDDEREEEEGREEKEEDKSPAEQIEEDLDDKPVTVKSLKALQDHYDRRIAEVRRDQSLSAEEKHAQEQRFERLEERIDSLLDHMEKRDKVHGDEHTMIVPADDLNPTHQNPQEPEQREQQQSTTEKPKRKVRHLY